MSEVAAEWGMYVNRGIGSSDLPMNTGDGKDYAHYKPTTATRLSDLPFFGVALPQDANCAMIAVEGNPIRIRVGTTDATAAAGFPFFANTSRIFENQRSFLENLSFIDASGASDVHIFYGRIS